MNNLMIYGAGSIGRLFVQIATDINREKQVWNILGFLDDDENMWGETISGVKVLGGKDVLKSNPGINVVLGISNPRLKRALVDKLSDYAVNYPILIHPRAWLSNRIQIGEGSVIYPGVCIDPDVRFGRHVLINKNTTIGHDCRIGDYVNMAPGVNIGGNVRVKEGCEFGISSSTIQNLSIGAGSIIGAGACVIQDVPDHCTAVGVPAKPVKFHNE